MFYSASPCRFPTFLPSYRIRYVSLSGASMLCSIVPQPEFFNRTILERLLIIKNELLAVARFQRGKGYFCVLHNSLRKIKIPGHYKVITERTRHLIRYAACKACALRSPSVTTLYLRWHKYESAGSRNNRDPADCLAETEGFEPSSLKGHHDFESSVKKRTWRNLTEDNGRCESLENAVFSRLSAPVRIENAAKIRVRESPPILPSSNGFSEKPIRIFDRTERFFAPKSRFWQCVKSTGYAGQHPKSCRLIRFKKWIFTEFSLFRSWKWKFILNTDNTYPRLK